MKQVAAGREAGNIRYCQRIVNRSKAWSELLLNSFGTGNEAVATFRPARNNRYLVRVSLCILQEETKDSEVFEVGTLFPFQDILTIPSFKSLLRHRAS